MSKEKPDKPSFRNYAVNGTVKLFMLGVEKEMASKDFATRWQRWDVEEAFKKLILPLSGVRRFYFIISLKQKFGAFIVKPLKNGGMEKITDGDNQ